MIKIDNHEYWWNKTAKRQQPPTSDPKTKTKTKKTKKKKTRKKKIPHNKPDLIGWDTDQKICQVIEFSCPCDVNLMDKTRDKINIYGLLMRNLKISSPQAPMGKVLLLVELKAKARDFAGGSTPPWFFFLHFPSCKDGAKSNNASYIYFLIFYKIILKFYVDFILTVVFCSMPT